MAGAFISLSDGEATWRQVAAGIQTDAEGRFKFPVYEGLSYIARAHYNLPDDPGHAQVHGIVPTFVATAQMQPLRVVLNRPVR